MIRAERLLQVFHWPSVYPIRLVLPGMLLLSLVLHGLAAYFVRTPAPVRTGALPPLPAKVTVFRSPGGGESVLLAARDPSWVRAGRYRDRLLPPPQPRRLRSVLEPDLPPLVPVPAAPPAAVWVPSLPPLSVQSLLQRRAAAPSAPELAPVAARLEPAGPEVTSDVLARLAVAAPAQPPGLPVELLVVLDPAGGARHVWLLRSCGVPALDAAAQRAVQLSRFGPSSEGYRGVLRVVWGAGGTPS